MERLSFSPEHTQFFTYVQAVATGIKGNRDLSYDEAKDAFSSVLKQTIPPELIGVFLSGMRLKLESSEELLACVDAIEESKHHLTCKGVEIGYAQDGKTKFPPLMMLASRYISDIALHVSGDERLAPKYGYTPKQFIQLHTFSANLHFNDRKVFNPNLSQLTTLRNNINIRTVFNSVEKLNQLSDCAVIGMHHGPYFEKYTALYANKYRRLMILQGSEGTPEVVKKTKYWLIEGENITKGSIDPESFGIEDLNIKNALNDDEMLDIMQIPSENVVKMIQLNAAVLAFIYGKYNSIEESYEAIR